MIHVNGSASRYEQGKRIAKNADGLVSTLGKWPASTNTPELKRARAELKKRAEDLRKEEFQVALVGNYSSGKSTLVNALLNQRVLARHQRVVKLDVGVVASPHHTAERQVQGGCTTDGPDVMAILDGLYRSAEAGKEVTLDY